jgi:hypothetical protein
MFSTAWIQMIEGCMSESQQNLRRGTQDWQPQWQNLFVAPAYPEGYAEETEQEWAEDQAVPIQRRARARGGRPAHRRTA